MSDLVGNPEDRFSHDAAHIMNDKRMSFREKMENITVIASSLEKINTLSGLENNVIEILIALFNK